MSRKPTRIAQVAALADGTKTRAECAAAMGLGLNTFCAHEDRARKAGHVLRYRPVRLGRPIGTGYGLPSDVKAWLDSQTPNGGTRSDIIRAILIDAYNDEMEARQ